MDTRKTHSCNRYDTIHIGFGEESRCVLREKMWCGVNGRGDWYGDNRLCCPCRYCCCHLSFIPEDTLDFAS
jgi:hypothetical protein